MLGHLLSQVIVVSDNVYQPSWKHLFADFGELQCRNRRRRGGFQDDGIASELTERKERKAESVSAAHGEGYEEAFRQLGLIDQTAIAARLEEGLTYDEIAHELGTRDADAARLAVRHAIVRLAQAMRNRNNMICALKSKEFSRTSENSFIQISNSV